MYAQAHDNNRVLLTHFIQHQIKKYCYHLTDCIWGCSQWFVCGYCFTWLEDCTLHIGIQRCGFFTWFEEHTLAIGIQLWLLRLAGRTHTAYRHPSTAFSPGWKNTHWLYGSSSGINGQRHTLAASIWSWLYCYSEARDTRSEIWGHPDLKGLWQQTMYDKSTVPIGISKTATKDTGKEKLRYTG